MFASIRRSTLSRVTVLIAVASLASCSGSEPLSELGEKLVGDWEQLGVSPTMNSWMRLSSDGTYSYGAYKDLDDASAASMRKMLEERADENPALKLEGNRALFPGLEGRWKLDGTTLTLQYKTELGTEFTDQLEVVKCDESSLELKAVSENLKAFSRGKTLQYRRSAKKNP